MTTMDGTQHSAPTVSQSSRDPSAKTASSSSTTATRFATRAAFVMKLPGRQDHHHHHHHQVETQVEGDAGAGTCMKPRGGGVTAIGAVVPRGSGRGREEEAGTPTGTGQTCQCRAPTALHKHAVCSPPPPHTHSRLATAPLPRPPRDAPVVCAPLLLPDGSRQLLPLQVVHGSDHHGPVGKLKRLRCMYGVCPTNNDESGGGGGGGWWWRVVGGGGKSSGGTRRDQQHRGSWACGCGAHVLRCVVACATLV